MSLGEVGLIALAMLAGGVASTLAAIVFGFVRLLYNERARKAFNDRDREDWRRSINSLFAA